MKGVIKQSAVATVDGSVFGIAGDSKQFITAKHTLSKDTTIFVFSITAGDGETTEDYKISVTWTPIAYPVTVLDGTANEPSYKAGEKVTIKAYDPAGGKKFIGWTTSDDVSFEDKGAPETTFKINAKPVTVKANYKNIEDTDTELDEITVYVKMKSPPSYDYVAELMPCFKKETRNYTVNFENDYGITWFEFRPTVEGQSVTVTVDGVTLKHTPDLKQPGKFITDNYTLTKPKTDFVFSVKSKDQSKTDEYTITHNQGSIYNLTVNGGTYSGNYASESTVAITAKDVDGKVFDKWTTTDGVTFANANIATTTFVMPRKNVTVTANYKDDDNLLVGAVKITGETKIGSTLTAKVEGTNATGTFTYKWRRGLGGIQVGTNSNTYKPTVKDLGHHLSCVITHEGKTGSILGFTMYSIWKADGPAAPNDLVTKNETVVGMKDGQINGLQEGQEYYYIEDDALGWVAVVGPSHGALAPGTYEVRVAETDTHKAGAVAEVTIKEGEAATLSHIEIITPPDKLVYKIGDPLDITGMVVRCHYSNTTYEDLEIGQVNVSGFDSTIAGSPTLTVKVDEKTASFSIIILKDEDITYSVTYIENGGTGSMPIGMAINGVGFALPANRFIPPSGKEFKAWKIGEVEYSPGAVYIFTENTTVTAGWKDIPVTITSVCISPENSSLQKGTTGTFNSTVSGTGLFDNKVIWSVSGATHPDTKIDEASGVLTVAAGERAKKLNVTATSSGDKTKTGTATVTVTDEPVYAVTVKSGLGGGFYEKGATVTITASAAPTDRAFNEWVTSDGVVFENANSATTTFVMPANGVTVTGTYKFVSDTTYAATVNSGTGGGNFVEGQTVTIAAGAPATDKEFDKWATTDGVTFANANSATTTFVMPAKAVTVTATYKDADVLTTYKVTLAGNANATTDYTITGAADLTAVAKGTTLIVTAVKDITVNGNKVETGGTKVITINEATTITINKYVASPPSSGGGSSSTTTTYTIKTSASEGGKIDADRTVRVREGKDIDFDIKPNKGYEIEDVMVDGKSVGAVSSYEFRKVRANHTISATFKMIKVIEPEVEKKYNFMDVSKNQWYYDPIMKAIDKGWFSGTSDITFSPNLAMSRGMIVTVLWRMEGEQVSNANSFSDVMANNYYTTAVNWASENGIVTGYGNNLFGPNDSITREQMLSILYRYAKYKGYDTTQGGMAIREFLDYETISEYALPSLGWGVNTGLIQGANNKLMPKESATRAQVAAILVRFNDTIVK